MARQFNKKAETSEQKTYVYIIGLVISIFAIVLMIQIVKDQYNDLSFEKEYLAKDIALLVDTIYASPNDMIVAYPQNKLSFSFRFEEGRVCVFDEFGEKCAYFSEDAETEFIYGELTPNVKIDDKLYTPLVFEKKENRIEPVSRLIN
ncbi:MAG: hypothetical protein KKF44_00175 [Nanoarchaeota archaeon]|nr:hypothetical protein [Nanoarchaeota archaeon]